MRNARALALLLLSLLFIRVPLAADTLGAERTWVLDTLKKYSPDGWYIVNTYTTKSTDGSDFMEYWGGGGDDKRWESLNTIVHESSHGYMALDLARGLNYYISPTKSIFVRVGRVYRTNKMVDSIPEKLRTFRFSYVDSTEENLGSQSEGAYGLLDEMNAYWVGTQASADMLPLFTAKGAAAAWTNYFDSVNGSLYGVLEFRFFVLRYILWAKDNDATVYDDIMANAAFRGAFAALDKRACEFTTSWIKGRSALYDTIRKAGVTVKEQGATLWIGQSGSGTFFDIYELLRQEMAKPLYAPLLTALNDGEAPAEWPDTGVQSAATGGYTGKSTGDTASIGTSTEGSSDSGGSHDVAPAAVEPKGKVLFTLEGKDRKGDAKQAFVDIVKGTVTVRKDGAVFAMDLASLPDKLAFDAAALKPDYLEYEWAFDIDVDGDGTVDYSLSLSSAKQDGATPSTASILDRCSTVLLKYEGDNLSGVDAPVMAAVNGSTITLTVDDCEAFPMSSLTDKSFVTAKTCHDDGVSEATDSMDF